MSNKEYIKYVYRGQRGRFLRAFGGFLIVFSIFFVPIYFENVYKWIGAPFLIVPDLLGIIEQPKREDVVSLRVEPEDSETLELAVGDYFFYKSNRYDYFYGPEILFVGETGDPVVFKPMGFTMDRFYNSIWAYGAPAYRFQIEQDGLYQLMFQEGPSKPGLRTYGVGIVPDTVTGNEVKFVWSIWIQVLLLIGIISVRFVVRSVVPAFQNYRHKPKPEVKVDVMGDILQDIKEKQRFD